MRFSAQGYQSEYDPEAMMIAEFNYDALNGEALQMFEVNKEVRYCITLLT